MELIGEEKSLQQILTTSASSSNLDSEVSLYQSQLPATVDYVKNECQRLQQCFPQITPGFIVILVQRIAEKKMSNQHITDAINNLIDTYKYPIPTIADIISFDKKVKIYTHPEIINMIPKGYDFSMFEKIEFNGKVRWVLK